MDYKVEPAKIKSDFFKSIENICNKREISQLEEALASGKLLDLKAVALSENQKLALKIGY